MTDLVDRLRADADAWDERHWCFGIPKTTQLEREAAAEIERLRAALETAARRFELIACGVGRDVANPAVGATEAREALNRD